MTTQFQKDLQSSKKSEKAALQWLLKSKKVVSATKSSQGLPKNKIRDHERLYGDIHVIMESTSEHHIEVKNDGSINRTGNLFLETWSDNGERTGNRTVGWFDYDSHITHLVIYNRANPSKSYLFNYINLKEYVNKNRSKYREVAMSYDKEQMNRSQGLLVPVSEALNKVAGSKVIKL